MEITCVINRREESKHNEIDITAFVEVYDMVEVKGVNFNKSDKPYVMKLPFKKKLKGNFLFIKNSKVGGAVPAFHLVRTKR
ncbi:hypothetical protein ERJ70_03550 [Sediminibacillus dalangtanensis]|uniref:Uncharacterized protein n=1 Tax=Sediminibacillus dalangtanensis TaxID=2729421 RepID=A0ABX7VWL8_9BACI|nr:hypothetical protein ERJ70_03550 [Sediminibacillus dalangtanensis]